jgi:hypothetical protein
MVEEAEFDNGLVATRCDLGPLNGGQANRLKQILKTVLWDA